MPIKLNGREVVFDSFPNGETRIEPTGWLDRGNRVMFRYHSDADLIHLMLLKRHMDEWVPKGGEQFLTIAYMPYSRADRGNSNSVFSLRYVAKFINDLGFDRVTVVEPHSDVTCALLDRSHPWYVTKMMLPDVMRKLQMIFPWDRVVFPDAGAQKRYADLNIPHLVGLKHRDFATGKIESLQLVGDLADFTTEPRNALIIDDLCSYGGTFVRAAKALREMYFKKVYLLVAHLENSVYKGELLDQIDGIYTTDSIHIDEPTRFGSQKIHITPLEDLV